MFGAGVVLVIFGIIAVLTGLSLDGGGGDAFALMGLMPQLFGLALMGLGVILCFAGLGPP